MTIWRDSTSEAKPGRQTSGLRGASCLICRLQVQVQVQVQVRVQMRVQVQV